MKILTKNLLATLSLLAIVSCTKTETKTTTTSNGNSVYAPKEYVKVKHPEWSKNATIYEANIRHFTPKGTFIKSCLPERKSS